MAEIVEEAAKVYVHALAANGGREPDLVPVELIPAMQAHFAATYGQKSGALVGQTAAPHANGTAPDG